MLISALFVFFADVSRADEFQDGIVFAKIIGSNKWTKETAEKGSDVYFFTTIEITNTKSNFVEEIRGHQIKLRTGEFDKGLLGQTIPLHLTKATRSNLRVEYLLDCSEINTSWVLARYDLKSSK